MSIAKQYLRNTICINSMNKYCEDCGTLIDHGLCPNCQEESVILRDQANDVDDDFVWSKEFLDKCAEQTNG